MNVLVIALCLIGAVVAHPPKKCGDFPTKKPTECCKELTKLSKEDIFTTCDSECGKDFCCVGNCHAKGLNFLKDGKFDNQTAAKSLATAFQGDSTWIELASKSLAECITEIAAHKPHEHSSESHGDGHPPHPPCTTMTNGIHAMCVEKKLIVGCPKPTSSEECDKMKTFFTCMKME